MLESASANSSPHPMVEAYWEPEIELDCNLDYNYVSANMNKVWCEDDDIDLDEIEKPAFVEPSPDRLRDIMRRVPFEGDDWQ